MCPNLQFPADLVTFTEEILNEKLHFLCSDSVHSISSEFGFCKTLKLFKKTLLLFMIDKFLKFKFQSFLIKF